MAVKKTHYTNLPPHTSSFLYSNGFFYVKTNAHNITVKVSLDSEDFAKTYCNAGCEYFRETQDVVERIKRDPSVTDKTNITSRLVANYCLRNGVCTGSTILQEECMAGNKLSGDNELEVEMPALLWVWNTNKTNAKALGVYAEAEENVYKPLDYPNIYPDGSVCWKNRSTGKENRLPQDIEQAYNLLFESPFNKETSKPNINIIEALKNPKPLEDGDDIIELIPQAENWQSKTDDTFALMTTTDSSVISKYPSVVTKDSTELNAVFTLTDNPDIFLAKVGDITCIKKGKLKSNTKVELLFKR